MKLTRRTVLTTGALAGLAVSFGRWAQSAQFFPARRLLTDEILLPHCKTCETSERIVVTAGRFIDLSFVHTLPSGAYVASLTPANELLMLEICRELRIATRSSVQGILFEIEAVKSASSS